MVRKIVHPTDLNLFRFLKQFGVQIDLPDDEHRKAIDLTKSFVQKIQKMYRPEIIRATGFDILHQLLNAMEVNYDIIEQVITEENERRNMSGQAEGEFRESVGEFRESEDSEFMLDLIWKKEAEEKENNSCEDENMDVINEREMYKKMVAVPTDKDMEELKCNCVKIGCRLNEDQATLILNRVTQFLSDSFNIFSEYESSRKKCMGMFMEKVQEYMERSCVLNDVRTVENAIKTVEFKGHKYLKEMQTENNNAVPAKEGGIATAMLQLKIEERRERADMELD